MFLKPQKNDPVLVFCICMWALVNFFCMSISSPYCSFEKYLWIWVVGLSLSFFVSNFMKSREINQLSAILWILHILIIFYLVFFTQKVRGSKRWLFIFNTISYQPSEGMKLFYIILFSDLLSSRKYYACAGIFLVSTILLILQPDLGNVILLTLITLILLLNYGIEKKVLLALVICAILTGAGVLASFPHAQKRFLSFFSSNKSSGSYQNLRALAAIKAGGITGVGPGKGTIKNVLPDAYSDFVFAVIGEELGLLGCTVVCLSFLVFFMRIWYYFKLLPLCRESLCIIGIGCLITIQAWIHMGSVVWIIPTKGTSLPFISHGGTSIIISNIGLGIIFTCINRARKRKVLY